MSANNNSNNNTLVDSQPPQTATPNPTANPTPTAQLKEQQDDSTTTTTTTTPQSNKEDKEGKDIEAAPPPAMPAMPDFPEGGLWGWLNVLGAFRHLFVTFGYVNAFGVYQSYYQLNQLHNETPSNISWIGSIQLWLQFSMGAVAGPLFDRGHFRPVMTFGSVLYVFALFMTSLTKKYYQVILAQAIGMGLGMGLLFLPAIGVLSHYFMKRRSLAMGIAVSGSSIGGICWPIMLNNIFEKKGFEEGVRATGYLTLACLVVANACMRTRLPARKHSPPPSPIVLFREPKYAIAVVAAFFIALGIFFPVSWSPPFSLDDSCGEGMDADVLSFSQKCRTFPNALADKVGSFNLILPCCASSTILIFAMIGAKNPGGAIAFAILFGFFSGGYVSLLGPVFISMAKGVNEIGVRVGYAFIIVGLAALAGTPISGALLVRSHNKIYAPVVFSGVCCGIGSVLLFVARTLHARDKGTWKV
ncbi:MFS general substrate transporter [Meredithblackwellia eburnea MCA 4105]